MRTAIRILGWLFLFLGGLKSLMRLMSFRGIIGFMGHIRHIRPIRAIKQTHNHQPSITTAYHNHLPSISFLQQTKKTDCHHW